MADTRTNTGSGLDLKGVSCPLNIYRTKLKLEHMRDGEILEIDVDDGEPMQKVPRSLKEDGHRIVKVERGSGGGFRLFVMKGGHNNGRQVH